ncbi:MAG: DUF799 family lipoprotein [Nitrospirae bacterium]|nr:DUF799 family lipoprotein [Nitrospirota bacterium]
MTKRPCTIAFMALFVCLSLSACVTLPQVTVNATNPIRTVAVLPLVNNTPDVDAPAYVRGEFTKELAKHYYVIKPLGEVDQILKDQMGVTLGVQLDMATPKKLGEVLGVDGVFYGSLDEFGHKITGVYNVKRVRLRTKLVNCKTGETVWKNGVGVKSVLTSGMLGSLSSLGASFQEKKETGEELKPLFGDTVPAPWHELQSEESGGMGAALAASLAEKVISKALKAPLKTETEAAVRIILNGYYHAGGWLSPPVTYGAMVPSGPVGEPAGPVPVSGPTVVPVAIPVVPTVAFEHMAGVMFTYAFHPGGYWLGAKAYRPGEWTRWTVTSRDDQHQMEKAYLKKEADGKEWWRVAFVEEEGKPVIFEGYFASGQSELLRLRGKIGGGEPSEIPVTKGALYHKPAELTAESWKAAFVRKESVAVPAGTFQCDYLVYSAMGAGVSEWWLSKDVPGGVVKYLFREAKEAKPVYEISLAKYGANAATTLGSY